MYDFHYNFIKKNFNAELLFTETDSLAYEIKLENVYEEFYDWKDLFYFSNFSKDLRFYDDTNKRVIGKMKDEYGGVIIDEFIGLKAKMCSIKRLIVVNLVLLNEQISQQNLINLKMFCLIKNY